MARSVNDRLEIARWVAAAGTMAHIGNASGSMMQGLAKQIEDHAWSVADGLVSRAEAMRAEDAEIARMTEKAAEAEAAKRCRVFVPDGFDGPCVLEPHDASAACENKAGDKW